MSICCPICYRPGSGTEIPKGLTNEREISSNKNNDERLQLQLQRRFCKLFERYLAISGIQNNGSVGETKTQLEFLLNEATEFGIVTCGECLKVMESFCSIHSQIKKLELLLNWKAWTLKNIMEQGNSSEAKYLWGCIGKLDGDNSRNNQMLDTLNLAKTTLIEKCSQKLDNAFPRILIPRWKSANKTQRKKVTATVISVAPSSKTVATSSKQAQFNSSEISSPNKRTAKAKAQVRLLSESRHGKSQENEVPVPSNTSIPQSKVTSLNSDYMIDHDQSHSDDNLPDPVHDSEDETNYPDLFENSGEAQGPSIDATIRVIDSASNNLLTATTREATSGSVAEIGDVTPISNAKNTCSAKVSTELQNTKAALVPISDNDSLADPVHVTKLEVIDVVHIEPISKFELDLGEPVDDIEPENPSSVIIDDVAEPVVAPIPKRRKLINTFPSNMAESIGKRLRTRHSCSKCNMTFSSLEKLLSHEKSHESSNALINYDSSSSTSSSPEYDDAAVDDDDALSWTSSLSGGEDEYISDEYDMNDSDPELTSTETSGQEVHSNESDSKLGLSNIPSLIPSALKSKSTRKGSKSAKLKNTPKHRKRNKKTFQLYRHLRYKCPDCGHLCFSMWSLLLHRQNSKQCSKSFDPKTSIKVEILIPKDTKKIFHAETNSTIFAIIDLPQEIFTCEICQLSVGSAEDISEHKKLHGTFKCNFCEAEFDHANSLPAHELEHFMDKQTASLKQCPRCDLKLSMDLYASHHLKYHLDLILNEPICAICKTTAINTNRRKDHFPDHLKRYHDLSGVTNPKEIYRCTYGNCSAYFLIARHLQGALTPQTQHR